MPRAVITGGPFAGKTTVIEALAARGHETLPEAAIRLIAEWNEELGLEEQKRRRSTAPEEFQAEVLRRQLALEDLRPAPPDAWQFLDRAAPDSLAYARHFGIEFDPTLIDAARARRYERVFLFDTLSSFETRDASGRMSTLADARRITAHLERVYTELGMPPVRIPELPVEARVRRILDEVYELDA